MVCLIHAYRYSLLYYRIQYFSLTYSIITYDLIQGEYHNWKRPAVYSQELVDLTESSKEWNEYSHGQDQEDVWLYENWFYGKLFTHSLTYLLTKSLTHERTHALIRYEKWCNYGIWSIEWRII